MRQYELNCKAMSYSHTWVGNFFEGGGLFTVCSSRVETAHALKKLVHECQFVPLSTRVIALDYLELHVHSRIGVSKTQIFLLPKHAKCLIINKTG